MIGIGLDRGILVLALPLSGAVFLGKAIALLAFDFCDRTVAVKGKSGHTCY